MFRLQKPTKVTKIPQKVKGHEFLPPEGRFSSKITPVFRAICQYRSWYISIPLIKISIHAVDKMSICPWPYNQRNVFGRLSKAITYVAFAIVFVMYVDSYYNQMRQLAQ